MAIEDRDIGLGIDWGGTGEVLDNDAFYALSSDTARDRAEREGLDIVYPTDTQLFVDIDSDAGRDQFSKYRDLVAQFYGIDSVEVKLSKSGYPHAHIIVNLQKKVHSAERIFLQAILGSDPKREMLGWQMSETHGDSTPTLFFEAKK